MNADCQALIDKSHENMDAAMDLAESKKFNAAANRLYYSLFQVAKAYAVAKNKMKMTDSKDVHNKANELVCELLKDDGRFDDVFEDALTMRKKSDYMASKVTESELNITFRGHASDLRDELEKRAKSA